MRERLISLLHAWAEREVIRTQGRGLAIPDAGYVWVFDKQLQSFHRGSYDTHGHWIPLQTSFTLVPGTARSSGTKLDDFGVAMWKLEEVDRGLIIMAELGGRDEWEDYLSRTGLSMRHAERRLSRAWLMLIFECHRRGLV